MIFYQIKKVFEDSSRREILQNGELKMENGELRSGKALCGRPTAAPAVRKVQMGYKRCAETAPYGIIRYQTKPADAVHDHRANELRDTGIPRGPSLALPGNSPCVAPA